MASYTGELQSIFLMLLNTLLILAMDEWHKCWNEMNVEVTCRNERGARLDAEVLASDSHPLPRLERPAALPRRA
jgi:hypothetical protein